MAKNKQSKETAESTPLNSQTPDNIFSDVLGSYTGVPEDGGVPIQDADDL